LFVRKNTVCKYSLKHILKTLSLNNTQTFLQGRPRPKMFCLNLQLYVNSAVSCLLQMKQRHNSYNTWQMETPCQNCACAYPFFNYHKSVQNSTEKSW